MVYRTLVADSHHFDENQDPDPDQHFSEKLDPAPDPNESDADPQPWLVARFKKRSSTGTIKLASKTKTRNKVSAISLQVNRLMFTV